MKKIIERAKRYDIWESGCGECFTEKEETISGEYVEADDYNKLYEAYLEAREDIRFLRRLESAGVDNWEGYEYAQDMYNDGDD